MKKVFISYSHKDKDWVRDWLLPRLEKEELQTHIDFRDFEIGVPSVVNMERAVEQCAKTILVFTPDWVKSEWCNFEGIMLQTEDPIGLKKKILPLMLDHCVLPPRLKIFTYADFQDENNWGFQFERLLKQIKKDFAEVEEPAVKFPALADKSINIAGLPQTGYDLFGRQKELKILNEAWESAETNVLSFVACGGVGKSTLVNKWLEKMRWDNYRGAEKVFGWSFYSQGTKERVTSADKFISDALVWFDDPDPKKGSPWDKGQRLADLIRKKKTLLILDGLEPLQSAHDFEKGKIKDPALSILVTQLARKNNGLCVITTREKVPELDRFEKTTLQPNLDQISKEAGRALLRVGGVQGTDKQLEAASEQFGNHALAINLLASFLHEIKGHHIKHASKIPDLDIPEKQGKHPRRVIKAFEKRFGEGPEVQLLRIFGLFDRPVEMDAIKAVYDGPAIKGLTDKLVDLTEAQWQKLFEEMREYKLLAKKSTHRPDIVDCHPLVREHFGEKLQKGKPKAWKEAHGRLYEYYKSLPEKLYGKFLPDTLEEMEPLFAAVSHGCQAGFYNEAGNDIYWKRIKRRDENYLTSELGAFGVDLAVLSNLFEVPWSKPAEDLYPDRKAVVLGWAGLLLRALGRLTEAAQPMQAGLELRIKQKVWESAAINAGNLSELYLALGEMKKAVDYARESVKYADKSKDHFQIFSKRTTDADARHQAGKVREAKKLFQEAENIQKEKWPEYHYLYSLQGFQFCDLLLSFGQYKEVQKRASETIKIAVRSNRLLDMALDNLSLGRAYLIEAVLEKTDFTKAADFLNQAVDGLREAGTQHHIPKGLLARAELHRYQRSWEKAWRDLEEAKEIAERDQMNLYLADYHLEAARLCLAEGKRIKDAREYLEDARERIGKMEYHRRDPEVLLIQAELELAEGKKPAAKKTLKAAERRINEMGCHRWDIEVERLQSKLK